MVLEVISVHYYLFFSIYVIQVLYVKFKAFFYSVGGMEKYCPKNMYSILIVQYVTLLYLEISQTLRYFGLIFGGF